MEVVYVSCLGVAKTPWEVDMHLSGWWRSKALWYADFSVWAEYWTSVVDRRGASPRTV